MNNAGTTVPERLSEITQTTVYSILIMISISHLLNDTIQSLIPSIYPVVKNSFHLNFTQVGLITLTFQMAASLLQPLVGTYTDRKPKPFSLVTGMGFSLVGLLLLSAAGSFAVLLISVGLIGVGSSIFHPEASKVAYMASGGKRGLAQSIFQVGGNAGSSLGPLLAALIIVPYGSTHILYFCLLALIAIFFLTKIGYWYKTNLHLIKPRRIDHGEVNTKLFSKKKIIFSIVILLLLI